MANGAPIAFAQPRAYARPEVFDRRQADRPDCCHRPIRARASAPSEPGAGSVCRPSGSQHEASASSESDSRGRVRRSACSTREDAASKRRSDSKQKSSTPDGLVVPPLPGDLRIICSAGWGRHLEVAGSSGTYLLGNREAVSRSLGRAACDHWFKPPLDTRTLWPTRVSTPQPCPIRGAASSRGVCSTSEHIREQVIDASSCVGDYSSARQSEHRGLAISDLIAPGAAPSVATRWLCLIVTPRAWRARRFALA